MHSLQDHGLKAVVTCWGLLLVLSSSVAAGELINATVHAEGLLTNRLRDKAEQSVQIYLPPSYQTSLTQKYPVLLLLHGFSGSPGEWTMHGHNVPAMMDSLISRGSVQEMIVVFPNGRNRYLGSFYTNSSTGGAWEDFIAQDVVRYVDQHFRTLPQASSRGIAGHSMGGYGAILLGMKHPDIFSVVYAMSPCCVEMTAEKAMEGSWPTSPH